MTSEETYYVTTYRTVIMKYVKDEITENDPHHQNNTKKLTFFVTILNMSQQVVWVIFSFSLNYTRL